jgi:hypothetical protein
MSISSRTLHKICLHCTRMGRPTPTAPLLAYNCFCCQLVLTNSCSSPRRVLHGRRIMRRHVCVRPSAGALSPRGRALPPAVFDLLYQNSPQLPDSRSRKAVQRAEFDGHVDRDLALPEPAHLDLQHERRPSKLSKVRWGVEIGRWGSVFTEVNRSI